jgi:hypothetical protein
MSFAVKGVRSMEDLRRYVHETLCEHENLLADQFQLQELPLTRLNEDCGRQYLLRGPRQVQLGAVWARPANTLYFYDARGFRFRKEALPSVPTDT